MKKDSKVIKKDVDSLKSSIEEMKGNKHSISEKESKTSTPKMPIIIRLFEILSIIGAVFFFGIAFIGFFIPIQQFIFSFLTSIDQSVRWPAIYIGVAYLVTILLYYNVFRFGFLGVISDGLDQAWKRCRENFMHFQIWFIVIGAILLIPELFLMNSTNVGDEFTYGMQETSQESKSQFQQLIEEVKCSLSVECIEKQQNQEENQQAETTAYDMRISPSLNSYRESQLENREFPINLEVQSRGGNLYLEKVECYKGAPLEENLIDSNELDGREIEQDNLGTIGGVSCDLSSLEVNQTQDIKITPAIYYTLTLDYTQQIPIVDYQLYREEVNGEITQRQIKDEVSVESPTNTVSNALTISRNLNPGLPIIINTPQNGNQNYFLDLTFEKNTLSLGEIQSTQLKEVSYSENTFEFTNLSLPYTIEAYDGITSLPLEFRVIQDSLESQGTSQITLPIKMQFENTLVKKNQRISFTLIDDQ